VQRADEFVDAGDAGRDVKAGHSCRSRDGDGREDTSGVARAARQQAAPAIRRSR
jgi:hypothetical protein